LEEIALVHLELAGPGSARKITNRIYDTLAKFGDCQLTDLFCGQFSAMGEIYGDAPGLSQWHFISLDTP
jgi:hypothetical protein